MAKWAKWNLCKILILKIVPWLQKIVHEFFNIFIPGVSVVKTKMVFFWDCQILFKFHDPQ
jgi:hypothetical protein